MLLFAMIFTSLPIGQIVAFAANDTPKITSIKPNKVSAGNGNLVEVSGSGFGTDKTKITATVHYKGGSGSGQEKAEVKSINDSRLLVDIPKSDNYVGEAILTIEKDGNGDLATFQYIPDPKIEKIIVNKEIKMLSNGKEEVKTYLEVYGSNFNLVGERDNVTKLEIIKDGIQAIVPIVQQREGFIKATLPEGFTDGKCNINIETKYGGRSSLTDQQIKLPVHNISNISKRVANEDDIITVLGNNFPTSNVEVYILDPNSNGKLAEIQDNDADKIEVKVPSPVSNQKHNIKVIDNNNNTAVTLIGELEILPKPTPFEVTEITPNAGPITGGTEVHIKGTGLHDKMSIKFGDQVAPIQNVTKDGNDKIIVVKSPASSVAVPVDITIDGKRVGTFTYIGSGSYMFLTKIDPDRGDEIGGEVVSIYGENFQRTKTEIKGDKRIVVSDEDSAKLEPNKKGLVFVKKIDENDNENPLKGQTGVIRERKITVLFHGENAEFSLDDVDFNNLNEVTSIGERGEQILKVKTPKVTLNPKEDTAVKVTVQVETSYKKEGDAKPLDGYGYVERQMIDFIYETIKVPIINEVTPNIGSISKDGEDEINPRVVIKGDRFLVKSSVDENDQRKITKPRVLVVPPNVTDETIKLYLSGTLSNPEEFKKNYEAEVQEVTIEKDKRIVEVDGVFNKVGTRLVTKFPSSTNPGYRDIIVYNPDGGITRIKDSFLYKDPQTDPKILDISPSKVSSDGGERVVITGENFEYYSNQIKLIVTINGEVAKIEKVERLTKEGKNIEAITIITPSGTPGKKVVQVINSDGGTAEGAIEYTTIKTAPKIKEIAPSEGTEGTEVIIKGDDFVIPKYDIEDEQEMKETGTKVFFGDLELKVKKEDNEEPGVYIIDKQTIRVVVPKLSDLPIKVDVKVVNPDASYDIREKGFDYKIPQSKPKIDELSPDFGTRDGGTVVTIKGSGFTDKVDVYFGEKKGTNVKVNGDGTEIQVTTPNYPVADDAKTGVTVPVTVVNYDGATDTKRDGFTFRVPGSFPVIEKIDPNKGSTAGYQTVVITGRDFRYVDTNGNGKYDEGEPIPKVYFGGVEAIEVKYSSQSSLMVKIPPYEKGEAVDVILVNPDAGTTTLKRGFTYETSKPTIKTITPDTIVKTGGTEVTIVGEGFINSNTDNSNINPNIDTEVIFGNESGLAQIVGAYSEVELGNVKVKYDNRDPGSKENIFVYINDELKSSLEVRSGKPAIVTLPTENGNPRLEGIKIEVKSDRLIVTRRLAPKVKYINSNTLEVVSPPMDGVGEREVKVVNKDGGTAKGKIIVKNPDSRPLITNAEPKKEVLKKGTSEIDYYSVESTLDGGLTFTLYGKDFRKGVKVFIGNQEAEVVSRSNGDDKIVVKSPKGRAGDVNKPLRIVVVNEDGGIADSSAAQIDPAKKPLYYIYKDKESNPVIEEIIPNKGSAKGGEKITIIGNDFRVNDITVRIGAGEAKVIKEESSYNKLVVITPPSDILGPVDVFIKNNSALGETVKKGGFTYISSPVITRVNPREVHHTGGHKVTISGIGFQQGAKIFIGDTQVTGVKFIDSNTIEITSPKVELNSKQESVTKDVRIENPDGGTYTYKNGITFILPIPGEPTRFRAYPGHERSIILEWDKVEEADRYKIYAKSRSNDDYEFLGETTDLKYVIKDLKPDTRYYFKLWAVNEYGESRGYAYDYATTLKSKDDQGGGKYEDKDITTAKITYTNGELNIAFPKEFSYKEYQQALTDSKYDNYTKIKLTIPTTTINKGVGYASLRLKDLEVGVALSSLRNSSYFRQSDDTNVVIDISKLDSAEKSRITKNLPAYRKASEGYEVKFYLQDGRQTYNMDKIEGLGFTFITDKYSGSSPQFAFNRYVPEQNGLVYQNTTVKSEFDYTIRKDVYRIYSYITLNGKYVVTHNK
ncbi:cell surface receptor IPT/TIG and fibronectin domain-containing protein [Gottschalkia purinilytica]|uniref:Cell surface receptor IPT/TIG and fibronectin domain-containing protein n=1 Tax=Gottschalkia purinilytica TaxID=1503 RepID=A0A0L0WEB8_GOTPU|nr:cell surface receptor IPT/TIG and fibronectin domain-containing protein [Gottschalkia purinilytica]